MQVRQLAAGCRLPDNRPAIRVDVPPLRGTIRGSAGELSVDENPAPLPPILQRIQNTRRDLLDLSARNRLISTPRGSSQGRRIEVVDERAEDLFRLLVRERRAMSFLPAPGEPEAAEDPGEPREGDPLGLPQPADDPAEKPADGPDPRHSDTKLQTRLTSERLQQRLLDMAYDARTYEQDQGVSILYLAIGFLKWYETAAADRPRFAPLLLIPVDLDRSSVASRFTLRFRDEDVATNLSLQEKLRAEFGISLPDVPDLDDLSPSAYFDEVKKAARDRPRWEVLPDDVTLWFFSFAKYLMYRDLDPSTWPEHAPLAGNPTLARLLGEGFEAEPPICGDLEKIDPLIPVSTTVHVTDADSSQAIVIEEVRRGRDLVVQGPPGTGKSQTITNLIASAVKQGKTVLFVAEKLAALEVVSSRLDRMGLGAMCLPLHSNKANKKAILEDLARTIGLGRPKDAPSASQGLAHLQQEIASLNRHAEVMNTPVEPSGLTPFAILGRLARLYGRGVEATALPLTGPDTWTPETFAQRLREVSDLQEHLKTMGPPSSHPWRGVRRVDPLLPADFQDLRKQIAGASAALGRMLDASRNLADALGVTLAEGASRTDADGLVRFAGWVVDAPPIDTSAILNPAWNLMPEDIGDLAARGERLRKLRDRLDGQVSDLAWTTDLGPVRTQIAAHGRSWFRWFRGSYREAVRTLKGLHKGPLPGKVADRLDVLDSVIAAQGLARSLDERADNRELGREAFGSLWRGSESNWAAIDEVVRWDARCRSAKLPWGHREVLARLGSLDPCRARIAETIAPATEAPQRLGEIDRVLSIDPGDAFGADSLDSVAIRDWVDRLQSWDRKAEDLSVWMGYQRRRRKLEEAQLGALALAVHQGGVAFDRAVDVFEVAYHQSLIREVFRRDRDLAEFEGPAHAREIETFRALDLARLGVSREEVATAHYEAIPRGGIGGEMKVVRREIEKKRRHIPIRKLMKEAGNAIQGVKPVFMMSPISVAQYLEPGGLTFDLLLIDEASQITPVDALGAMARAKQVVVVGDDKQLPPTKFFSKMIDDGEPSADDEGDLNAGDLESILGLCVAQGMSQRMLRWHYRSRHHSLIAVSNREFYDGRLFVVPSPYPTSEAAGLRFRHIPEGRFDRGNSATNRVEARAIAQAVIDHAASTPQKSLGVGAFSVAQRDAIRAELEPLLRERAELSAFFAGGRPEAFFIKNLENIQGDERDVIFISVGYARDPSGALTMNFGPLSSSGGERRLNVLISRARERCEVFSSITADDIDLDRARSRGASAFRTFLRYAQTGVLEGGATSQAERDSDFEAQVAESLERLGHEVRAHVGTEGFVIDLAVVDPSQPGRYLLGIECDGATYHSARSARDRDRLRESVLRDRGWNLHRVWSVDWFHRPEEQLQKLVAAIEAARLRAVASPSPIQSEPPTQAASAPIPVPERHDPQEEPTEPEAVGEGWVTPYVVADFAVPKDRPIPEVGLNVLTGCVADVVKIEGPIHRDEVARRVLSLWGQPRSGARISEAIQGAIDEAVATGRVRAEGEFLAHVEQTTVPVRSREGLDSPSLKKAEMIAPSEMREAIGRLVENVVGVRRDEVASLVAKALGFKTTPAKLKESLDALLEAMIEAGSLTVREERLYPS